MSSVIILDSSDEEVDQSQHSTTDIHKRKGSTQPTISFKRIKPTFMGILSTESQQDFSPSTSSVSTSSTINEATVKQPFNDEFQALIEACRLADKSEDMKKLIDTKLTKYYYSVHPDFIKSKNFKKIVLKVTEDIQCSPELVYIKVKTVVEELRARKKQKPVVMNNEESAKTGSKKRDDKIKILNIALLRLARRIERVEEEDVDWNDDNSSYLQVERYKKRACEIYRKICELTGESKNAHRSVKRPILFNGTSFAAFNKTIQTFVNKTKQFPDFYDVYKVLDHCNTTFNFGLGKEEKRKIAEDAFIKIGKLLQDRRKTDLYETVQHFTLSNKDPALSDPELHAKLNDNMKKHKSISSIIDKYAREQDNPKTGSSDTSEETNENDENASQSENEVLNTELMEKEKIDQFFGSQSFISIKNKRNNVLMPPTKASNQLTVRTVDSLNKITPLEEIIISDSEET
ncbi:DAXX family protein [Megaselia abdita]